jgi:enediyne polyketide synthase
MTAPPIAIVGIACRYPDARTPLELWENVLAGRRAFRRLPRQRLPLDEYASTDRAAPDLAYPTRAALIDGYRFDRVHFRVSAATYQSVDLVHWLAVDVAAEALADAGFENGFAMPRDSTGVLVGNTLTGEFSRAAALRVRWPYVRRVVDAALEHAGESPERRGALLPRIEASFKAPFAPVDGETLAGSLSNTIAGRICNHFDFKGGGFTIDGACASSLLAVVHACSALRAGDLDVALAGGVDVSIDPFELVGFAKAGALASDEMRVYDAAPTGFWPGEGAGFVVLMREPDARASGRRIYAVVRGWGVSSDGSGGMTRPELPGQVLAIERAFSRAEVPIDSVAFFEGHGTGTAVGDATELAALSDVRRRSGAAVGCAALGSIKANIGHTKAAAGVAGLLKASLSLHRRLIPPASGVGVPHPLLTAPDAMLHLPDRATSWRPDEPRRASVSAMGFGGINVHVVLEGRDSATPTERAGDLVCARSSQDAELVLVSAAGWPQLRERVERLLSMAPGLSIAEVTDLAVELQRGAAEQPVRAALVVATPNELTDRLRIVRDAIDAGAPVFDVQRGVFMAATDTRPRVAFLFPGQGAPVRTDGGAWSRRYPALEDVYRGAAVAPAVNGPDTAIAQPAIITGCVAAVQVLRSVGLEADVAIGYSLGELAALWWAGAFDAGDVIALAATRGQLMAALADGPGAMTAIAASPDTVGSLLDGTAATVACINGPQHITVAGTARDVASVLARARDRAITATPLRVSHAFHSALMAPVIPALRKALARVPTGDMKRRVISTVTGEPISHHMPIATLLERQLCEPVRFTDALRAAGDVQLFIEVGPGHTLAPLASAATGVPAVSVDAGGDSLRGLLAAFGSAFALGAPLDPKRLAYERFARPFDLDHPKEFLVNPCEFARGAERPADGPARDASPVSHASPTSAPEIATDDDTCQVLRTLVAHAAELPLDAVVADARFLTDLHLNSLTVSELLATAARRIGVLPPMSPADYADASIADAAKALDDCRLMGGPAAGDVVPDGLDAWVRAFSVVEEPEPLAAVPASANARRGAWRIVSSPHHPLDDAVRRLFADDDGGPGILVCIDPAFPPAFDALLEAAQSAVRERLRGRFVVVQQEAIAGGFARSLFLETTSLDVCVVTLDFSLARAANLVRAEACAAAGFVEVRYESSGRRVVPTAVVAPLHASSDPVVLGSDDVLLVTGGGKGIAAECAMAVARATGVRLALLGRSRPEADEVLAANLERIRQSGATLRYVVADVTDAAQVRTAIATIREEYGDITAILHAAGVNTPALIATLDHSAVVAAIAPKIDGACNVLSAIDAGRLRVFIAFGSLIARTGLAGEAHYALANEWLRRLTTHLSTDIPGCRATTIEWSVWAATGMGERLGRVDTLTRRGVTPITIENGVALLGSLLAAGLPQPSVIATGRFGYPPPVRLVRTVLPSYRFIESVRLHYPGVELVADARISLGTDPYLADHCLEGQLLLPAVMGMEAMAQAAMALCGVSQAPMLEQLEFDRPIVIPRDAPLMLRTMAVVESDGRVRVALRADSTGFIVDHFRAICAWPAVPQPSRVSDGAVSASRDVDLDPAADLYGSLLFQSGRFARVHRYTRLLATECVADLTDEPCDWFGAYLPDALVLGDPGVRDAILHCIQASIPHRRVVPIGVERVVTFARLRGPCRVRARERSAGGSEFIWDISVVDASGDVIETWGGVRFRAIAAASARRLPAALLTPYLQRQIAALGHASVDVGVEANGVARNAHRHPPLRARRRPDGKPDPMNDTCVSTAHAGALTLRVAAYGAIGCDIERVLDKPERLWQDLLGSERIAVANLIAKERSESAEASATRVWTAMESLKKAGASPGAPLVFQAALDDGWVKLRAGRYTVSTWIGDVEQHERMAFAVATSERHAAV